MEDYVLINHIERVDHLRSLVRQDLRDIGIKLPKSKKLKKLNQSRTYVSRDELKSDVFGEHLCDLPCEFVKDHGHVPQFLIDAAKIINSHLDHEGIFRKSGSVCRQKELRQSVDQGGGLADANIYDVAVLVKQFFRDLPEPIFTSIYHDAFIRCYQLPAQKEPVQALLQLCLCLPVENIGTLRFTLHLLNNVALHAVKNKMNASNLSLVLAPNLMHSNKGSQKMTGTEEKYLHMEASIVEILIKNFKLVGLVNATLQKQVGLMTECFGTDDELDVSDDNTLENSKSSVPKKKRRRSGSLTGIVSSIASGFAKLRRSTDGRNMNVSSNSTFPGELSMASNTSVALERNMDSSTTTPCVMRKRRASGDAIPFSSSKKKAILGNLPQRSALVSTPFTPASTVKRNCINGDNAHLNATTPCQGSKASRKKLNLFTSPGSNKKVKRQSSLAKLSSPGLRDPKGKGKNFFRRLSGSRNDKEEDSMLFSSKRGGRPGSADSTSPRSTTSDSVVTASFSESISRSASSSSMHDNDVFAESYIGNMTSNTSINPAAEDADKLRRRPPKSIDKSEISSPLPVIVPIMANAKDAGYPATRRSRREEFEREIQTKRKGKFVVPTDVNVLEKSVCSQLDFSLMEAVLPPPSGFGDQTMLEEQANDGDVSSQDPLSLIASGKTMLSPKPCTTKSMAAGSDCPRGTQHHDTITKPSEETFIDVGGVEDMYVALKSSKPRVQEGDYVVLRKHHPISASEEVSQSSSQGGIELLQENYRSEEESSSNVSESHSNQDSDIEELKNIPSKPNIHRNKSLSSHDLQSSPKVIVPTRSQSQYISPCKKFNYKPHLEISKETHRILTNAGYLKAGVNGPKSKDILVPVKSPKRSAYREEMIQSLRYSFHERHNRTNRSVLGKSIMSNNSMDSFDSSVNSVEQCLPGESNSVIKTDTVVRQDSLPCVAGVNEVEENSVTVSNESHAASKSKEGRICSDEVPEERESSIKNDSSEECHPLAVNDNKFPATAPPLSIKDCDSSLTLSGFLDHEIKRDNPPVKIKRAELNLPTHDSVSNLKVFQTGLVAENVKQFSKPSTSDPSQARKMTFPSNRKRGTSPVRIPTIFAKSGGSFKHYQEITQFVRERTGSNPITQLASSSLDKTPSPTDTAVLKRELSSQDSLLEGVVPVLETNQGGNVDRHPGESSEDSEPLRKPELINNLAPALNKTGETKDSSSLKTDKANGELLKSPLQESTNTASSHATPLVDSDSIKLYSSAGLTPKRLLLKVDGSVNHRNPPRPQLKRLKRQRSPRRARTCKSPTQHAHAEVSLGERDVLPSEKLAPVAISLEDQKSESSQH